MSRALALVTGATGGIGRTVTAHLWQEGYHVLGIGHTPAKVAALQDWLVEHERQGQHSVAIPIDLASPESLWRIHNLLQGSPLKHHALSLLVLCHGAAPLVKPTMNLTPDDMRRVWDVDVLGTLTCCQLALRYMVPQQHGSIVVVSSLHSQMTYPQRTLYATSKAALGGMVRALAVEHGQDGITVNAICPWQVEGPRSQAFIDAATLDGYDLAEAWKQRSPMRRLVTPEEVAETVIWLSKTLSVNGAEIILDGGTSKSMWYQPFIEKSTTLP